MKVRGLLLFASFFLIIKTVVAQQPQYKLWYSIDYVAVESPYVLAGGDVTLWLPHGEFFTGGLTGEVILDGFPSDLNGQLEVSTVFYYEDWMGGIAVCNNGTNWFNLFNTANECFINGWDIDGVTNYQCWPYTLTITVEPVSAGTISGPSGEDRCADTAISLTGTSGYSSYRWQYRVDGSGTWNNIKTTTSNSASISFSELTAPYDERIFFRYGVGLCPKFSNEISYIFLAQPLTIAGYTAQKPTCANGSDGGIISVTYNRAPLPGEVRNFLIATSTTLNAEGGIPPGNLVNNNELGAGTYYLLAFSNYGNCGAVSFTTAVVPAGPRTPITVNTSVATPHNGAQISCSGATDGQITVTSVSGGNGSGYQYKLGTGSYQTGSVFTGVGAGTHTITVKDNCATPTVGSKGVTVTAPTAVSVNATPTHVSCNGGSNGSITASASGGTGTRTFRIGTGSYQASGTFSGLSAGTYTITAKDANNCTSQTIVSVTQPAALSGTAVPTGPSCAGSSNGSITITASGGTPSYTYSKNGTTFQASNALTGYSAGTHTVYIRDSKGCVHPFNVTVTDPLAVTATGTPGSPGCIGGSNGTITVNASGGGGTYTYSKNGTTYQASNVLTGYGAGTHTVYVRDQNLCPFSFSVGVSDPSPVTASTSVSQPSCFGGTNGTITVNASGGAGGYTYSKDGATFQASNVLTGFNAGSKTIYVRDQNSCSASFAVVVSQPTAVTASASSLSDVTCNGGADGSVTVTASGGTGTKHYSKDGVNFQTSNILSGFTAGTKTITVRDANACTYAFNVAISEPAAIAATAVPAAATCNGGNDGAITVNVTSGTGPFEYSLDGTTFQTTNVFDDLVAGNYVVTVRGAHACTITRNVTVSQPSAVGGVIVVSSPVSCFGISDGALNLTASGGTSPYSFTWSNGAATEDISAIAAGNYSVLITDSKGCTGTANIVLGQPNVLGITHTLSDYNGSPVSCKGQTDGLINITVSGGTSPYTYAWSNGATSEDIVSLAAGTYTVVVTDNRGCELTETFTLTEPDALASSVEEDGMVSCFGGNNGFVELKTAGGTPGYLYSINSGSTWQSTSRFESLAVGTYTILTRDLNGCTIPVVTSITSPTAVGISVDTNDTQCGQANGSAGMVATGGVGEYSYQWYDATMNPVGATVTISNLVAGTYHAETTDGNGCSKSQVFTISASDGPSITASATDATCSDRADGAAEIQITGGTAPYGVEWPDGSTALTASALVPGSYIVSVTDQTGCTAFETITVSSPPAIGIVPVLSTNPSCPDLSDGSVEVVVSGGNGGYNLLWNNGQIGNKIENIGAGTYTLTVTDIESCQLTRDFTLADPLPVAITTTLLDEPTCFASADGRIQVQASGGNGSYNYVWDNGVIGNQLINLEEGTYTINVTDQLGCVGTAAIMVNDPDALVIETTVLEQPSCFGSLDGIIEVTASGGNGNYSFTWDNGSAGERLENVSAGDYEVSVADAKGCSQALTGIVLVDPAQMSVSTISTTNPNCHDAADGRVEVSATGGTGVLQYEWSNGATGQTLAAATAGSYILTVTDEHDCEVSNTYVLTEPSPLQVSALNTKVPTCYGYNDGFIELTSSGGTGSHTFTWSTGSVGTLIDQLTAGIYTVTVADANGCITNESFEVVDPEQLTIDIGEDPIVCPGQTFTVTPGIEGVSYQWTGPNFTSSNDAVTISAEGNYTVHITDSKGCTAQDNFVLIISEESLKADFLMVSEAYANDTIAVVDISWPVPTEVAWDFGIQAKIISSTNEVTFISYAEPGLYTVTLEAALAGCRNTSQQSITILKQRETSGGRVAEPESIEILSYSVHPNPFRESFEVQAEFSRSAPLKVQVVSLVTNRTVFEEELGKATDHHKHYAVSQLTPGVYIVILKAGITVKFMRLLKL